MDCLFFGVEFWAFFIFKKYSEYNSLVKYGICEYFPLILFDLKKIY